MRGDTRVTPERTALKTDAARTMSATFVALGSTFHSSSVTFFDGQHI